MRCAVSFDTELLKLRLEVVYPLPGGERMTVCQEVLLSTISAFPDAEMLKYLCQQMALKTDGVLTRDDLLRAFLNLLLASGALALGGEQLASLA
jgi:hypothetical protein